MNETAAHCARARFFEQAYLVRHGSAASRRKGPHSFCAFSGHPWVDVHRLQATTSFGSVLQNFRSVFLFLPLATPYMYPRIVYRARPISSAAALLLTVLGAHAQGYTNVAPQQGLDFTIPVTPIDFGTGVSFYDIDGDGWDDLTFANVDDSLIVYRNNEGTLQRMPSPAYAGGSTREVLWADVDNDGDPDLLITTFEGPVRLFRNNGDWTFTDYTATSGLVQAPGKRWGASFGDHNKDGFLDLYVCTYIYSEETYAYSKLNHLYRNNGNGTFTDVTLQAGVGNGLKASFRSVWMDVDLDGWPDLYVINDFAAANALFRNNGNGTFTDMAVELGLAETGEHCMSISLCDFDLDGDLDIYITNTGVFPQTNNARHMLLVNNGNGNFVESSTLYGLDIFEWGWGSLWVDHDNDGYQDLYIATYRELSLPVPNLFYKNNGGTSFTDAIALFNDPQITSSHSVARGDLDRDGHADIVVQNQHPFRPYLWKNDGGTNNHVRVSLEGTASNRSAIGSWIRVYAGGNPYIHYTVCGENYLGQSSQHILFGLGSAAIVDSIVVEFPSGQIDRYFDLPVNAEYFFREGDSDLPVITANGPLNVCAPATVLLDAGEYESYVWNTGATQRFLTVSTSGSYWVIVENEFGVVATSTPVEVLVGPEPVIVSQDVDPACAGEATGSIAVQNLAGVPVESMVWGGGEIGVLLEGLVAGVYTYTYTDVNGCTASGAVELLDPDPLFVLVVPVAATAENNGSISWNLFGGTPPFVVTVDGVVVPGGQLEDLASGTYAFEVTDSEGCIYAETVVIAGPSSILERDVAAFQVYPNPAFSVLHVEASVTVNAVQVLDGRGRSVLQQALRSTSGVVDIASLAPGAYLLEMHSADGVLRARFVKE